MKRSVLSVLLAVGLLSLSAAPAMATPEIVTPMPISIQVDGGWVPTDTAPTVINGRTLIPVRAAGEAIGATMGATTTPLTAIPMLPMWHQLPRDGVPCYRFAPLAKPLA